MTLWLSLQHGPSSGAGPGHDIMTVTTVWSIQWNRPWPWPYDCHYSMVHPVEQTLTMTLWLSLQHGPSSGADPRPWPYDCHYSMVHPVQQTLAMTLWLSLQHSPSSGADPGHDLMTVTTAWSIQWSRPWPWHYDCHYSMVHPVEQTVGHDLMTVTTAWSIQWSRPWPWPYDCHYSMVHPVEQTMAMPLWLSLQHGPSSGADPGHDFMTVTTAWSIQWSRPWPWPYDCHYSMVHPVEQTLAMTLWLTTEWSIQWSKPWPWLYDCHYSMVHPVEQVLWPCYWYTTAANCTSPLSFDETTTQLLKTMHPICTCVHSVPSNRWHSRQQQLLKETTAGTKPRYYICQMYCDINAVHCFQ